MVIIMFEKNKINGPLKPKRSKKKVTDGSKIDE